MDGIESNNDQAAMVDFCDYSIVADAITPITSSFSGETFAALTRVLECDDFLEVSNNLACD